MTSQPFGDAVSARSAGLDLSKPSTKGFHMRGMPAWGDVGKHSSQTRGFPYHDKDISPYDKNI